MASKKRNVVDFGHYTEVLPLPDLIADLWRPLPYLDEHGEATPAPRGMVTGTQRHFGRIRPLALFRGNRLPRSAADRPV